MSAPIGVVGLGNIVRLDETGGGDLDNSTLMTVVEKDTGVTM
jgi:hypothetical protein